VIRSVQQILRSGTQAAGCFLVEKLVHKGPNHPKGRALRRTSTRNSVGSLVSFRLPMKNPA